MSKLDLENLFAQMDFFAIEDEGSVLYCLDLQTDGPYLIASNELGNAPETGQNLLISCYGANDAFLWKVEFKDPQVLYQAFQASEDVTDFFNSLEKLAGLE